MMSSNRVIVIVVAISVGLAIVAFYAVFSGVAIAVARVPGFPTVVGFASIVMAVGALVFATLVPLDQFARRVILMGVAMVALFGAANLIPNQMSYASTISAVLLVTSILMQQVIFIYAIRAFVKRRSRTSRTSG